MGQIAGYVLDTLFLNSLNADLERLQRMNRTLSLVPETERSQTGMQIIETFVISPSADIGAIAGPYMRQMPATVRYLMRVLGARRSGGRQLLSYLLFQGAFCRRLIDLGHGDTMSRRRDLEAFLGAQW